MQNAVVLNVVMLLVILHYGVMPSVIIQGAIMLWVVMQNVVVLNVNILIVIEVFFRILSAIMLRVIMQNAVVLNVIISSFII